VGHACLLKRASEPCPEENDSREQRRQRGDHAGVTGATGCVGTVAALPFALEGEHPVLSSICTPADYPLDCVPAIR